MRLRGGLCEQLSRRPGRRAVQGEILYLVGQRARSLYFLRRGLVKTSRVAHDGREMVLQIHQSGEVFGELCLCSGERREQAIALEASEVVEMPLADLLAQLRRDPDATLELIALLGERLEEAHARLQSVAFEPTMERLVRTLLTMADTLGEPAEDGARIAHYITQEELAQLIGARREVVSGLLNRLRDDGLIYYSRKGRISVHRRALEAYRDAFARPVD